MRPLTDTRPKALVELAGQTLLDHQLARLQAVGVAQAVVNVHHFADQIEAHLAARSAAPKITISDEREQLLETGGGLIRAAKHLGTEPFYVMNVDAIWSGHPQVLQDLAKRISQPADPFAVLLLARRDRCLGLDTAGDFHMDRSGRLTRRAKDEVSDYYYSGVQIMAPSLLDGFAEEKFSTNLLWDKALAQDRLFGLELDGFWMHVGDLASLQLAENYLAGVDR